RRPTPTSPEPKLPRNLRAIDILETLVFDPSRPPSAQFRLESETQSPSFLGFLKAELRSQWEFLRRPQHTCAPKGFDLFRDRQHAQHADHWAGDSQVEVESKLT